jgi:hypothetical protein
LPDFRTPAAVTLTEFEHFIRHLFAARGLEGCITERSGDDEVDGCEASWPQFPYSYS